MNVCEKENINENRVVETGHGNRIKLLPSTKKKSNINNSTSVQNFCLGLLMHARERQRQKVSSHGHKDGTLSLSYPAPSPFNESQKYMLLIIVHPSNI